MNDQPLEINETTIKTTRKTIYPTRLLFHGARIYIDNRIHASRFCQWLAKLQDQVGKSECGDDLAIRTFVGDGLAEDISCEVVSRTEGQH